MRYVVVGGGVAGVCCVEELCRLCPDDSVVLVSADKVLKGVTVVARLSRTLEELATVERQLDELPYPNLAVVHDVAVGIDTGAQAVRLASGQRLPYDKLCVCSGARPKQLPPSVFTTSTAAPGQSSSEAEAERQGQLAAMQARVLTIRDTDSVSRLGAQLAHATRVAVVGNGGIALELIAGLSGVDVTWVMRHEHIGDAFFDLDAAQFLLEELQRQREQGQQQDQQQGHLQGPQCGQRQQGQVQQVQQGEQQQQGQGQQQHQHQQGQQQQGQGQQQQQHQQGQQQQGQVQQVQQQGQAAAAEPSGAAAASPTEEASQAGRQQLLDGREATPVLGHAVGPRWMQQLLPAAVAAGAGGRVSTLRHGRVELKYGCEVASIELAPQPDSQADGNAGSDAGSSKHSPALLLTLTGGEQVPADLVLLAIGVSPALEWVPARLQRAPDGGLKLDRLMRSSDPCIFAAGDSASCCWAADDSAHWFQMRLWSQARAMGVYAAHCMSGVQDQRGADMAFELFTHATHFLGHKVVLLGLYNGQRLEGEPHGDLISYSRVTEGPQRTFVRVLLLRGRVQGVVLIGNTGLEETFENLILDQLDVSQYGPSLLDPDFELDHVFD